MVKRWMHDTLSNCLITIIIVVFLYHFSDTASRKPGARLVLDVGTSAGACGWLRGLRNRFGRCKYFHRGVGETDLWGDAAKNRQDVAGNVFDFFDPTSSLRQLAYPLVLTCFTNTEKLRVWIFEVAAIPWLGMGQRIAELAIDLATEEQFLFFN